MSRSVASSARADDVNGAAKAFSQAQEAVLAGDNARAADLYELADELAPSAPALRNAARARLAADHDAMAATLAAELLRRYPSDKESRDVAEAILSKLSPQLTQFDITCDEPCTITLDGKAASSKPRTHHLFFAQPGGRTQSVPRSTAGARPRSRSRRSPGRPRRSSLDAPPKAMRRTRRIGGAASGSRAPTATAHGISRKWFIGSCDPDRGLRRRRRLCRAWPRSTRATRSRRRSPRTTTRTRSLYNEGRDEQLRTNILLGGAAAAGVATIVLGVRDRLVGLA